MKAFTQSGLFTDIVLLVGLSMLFYGLHSYEPWLAFTLVGAVLIGLGVLMLR